MALYSKTIMEHFKRPKNMGEMKNPDAIGRAGNLLCGDLIWLYIRLKRGKIANIKFQSLGCPVAIAVSSMITTLAKGKTLEEALKITKDDILKLTGKLPLPKIHCSVLVDDALHEAIYDYFSKNELPMPKELKERHERIQKELKLVEERHKEYVEFEKKILKK